MNFKDFDFLKFVKSIPIVNRLLRWSKKATLPGFAGIPIFTILKFMIHEVQRDDITTRANSMAFSFFLAIFPAIIFLFTLLPLFPVTEDYVSAFRISIHGVLPENAEEYIFDIINDVVSIPRGGLLSLGFVLAFLFSSNGIASMMKGFEKSYVETFRTRSYFQRQWTAVKLTILISVLLFVSITTIVLGNVILSFVFDFLGLDAASRVLLNIVRWILVLAMFHSVISSIYRYGAPTIKRFHYFSPGATVATIVMIIVSLLFSAFVNNFGTYNKLYGSIGTLIVVLVWIQFNCMLLLIGYEINASVAVNKNLLENETKKDK